MQINFSKVLVIKFLLFIAVVSFSCKSTGSLTKLSSEKPVFEVEKIFADERFPNIVVAKDGSVIVSWGLDNFRVRRSADGGKTWEPEVPVLKPGFQGGGTMVDEKTGDVLIFAEEAHPVAPLHVFRSKDNGITWAEDKIEIKPNSLGHTPSMHMNESGLTLKNGKYAGRLIRATRYYGDGNDRKFWDSHYTNAMFSDDGGKTWQASEPFPAYGTGEAAIAELGDGTLYYNSRRHKSTDGLNPRMRHIAWSRDGGMTWKDLSVSEELPDGEQCKDYGLMAGLVHLPIKNRDVLIYSNIESYEGRKNGTLWVSFDGGKTWPFKKLIEEGAFAYSSMAVGRKGTPSEGLIYLVYESGKGAKIARFNLAWLMDGHDINNFIKKSF